MKKPDVQEIAEKLIRNGIGWRDKNIHDYVSEALIGELEDSFNELTDEVIEKMQELTHPSPRNAGEDAERNGDF